MHKTLRHMNRIDPRLKHQSPHYGSVMTGAFFTFVRLMKLNERSGV